MQAAAASASGGVVGAVIASLPCSMNGAVWWITTAALRLLISALTVAHLNFRKDSRQITGSPREGVGVHPEPLAAGRGAERLQICQL